MPKGGHIKFPPMELTDFMECKIPKEYEDLSLLGRYKEYLLQNAFQHHYGQFEDMEAWLDYALKKYYEKHGGE